MVLSDVVLFLGVLIYVNTFHPSELEDVQVHCGEDAPILGAGQKIRVMNWNVQYMGMGPKRNVFWYDLPAHMDEAAKAKISTVDRPTKEDIAWTLDEVARVIKDENPDIVLLQEVDQDSGRTHNIDQIAELKRRLGPMFACSVDAWYWKAAYVPHPNISTSVGMKLLTLSKYKIDSARRHQLDLIPENWLKQQFNLKRAVLEARLPVKNAKPLVALNTHLSAFSQGSDTMQRQVREIHAILSDLSREGVHWFIGGDFNLLPPNAVARESLSKIAQGYYQKNSEIRVLFDDFQSVITNEEMQGPDRAKYFTHISNNPLIDHPDRTIDYIFYSRNLDLLGKRVRQGDALKISDHFPVMADFRLQR